MKSHSIELNGLKHHYITWGNPSLPKLFFFHGWMDMAASFHFMCEALQEDYHCIALDFRGMGQSEHSHSALGYFFYEYLADMHDFLNAQQADSPCKIIGHSMGGNIVSMYAGTYPRRVSHFVNLEGFGINDMPPADGPDRVKRWIDGRESRPFKKHPQLQGIAERLQLTNPRLTDERALFLAKHISKTVGSEYTIAADPRHKWLHPYPFQLKNIIPFWEQITAHCLLVQGAESRLGPSMFKDPNLANEIEQRLNYFPKNSKRLNLTDAGHMIHHDQPETLATAIKNFLQETT